MGTVSEQRLKYSYSAVSIPLKILCKFKKGCYFVKNWFNFMNFIDLMNLASEKCDSFWLCWKSYCPVGRTNFCVICFTMICLCSLVQGCVLFPILQKRSDITEDAGAALIFKGKNAKAFFEEDADKDEEDKSKK